MNNLPSDIPPLINPGLSITYRINRWDIFFNWMTIMVRNRLLQIFVPVSMIVCVGLRLLPKLGYESMPRLVFDAILECGWFIGFLVFFQAILGFASAFLMAHRGVVGTHTLEITEAGLIERTDVNETLHRWPGLCRIYSFLGYLYIYVGENNSHQVPKRDLPLEVISNFEAELRARTNLKR